MMGPRAFGVFLFFLVFAELEAYNLAFKKPTWQSETLLKFSSDKAVDGHFMNRSITGNECAISGGNVTEVTWYVDLESIQSINSVSIMYRTDGQHWQTSQFPSTFLGFSLYVSNTTVIKDRVLYYHDDQYTTLTIPPVLTVTKPVQARYVTYYNSRKGGLSTKPGYSATASFGLCEVQVFGCPVVGYHGESCTQQCPINCRHCHVTTGECLGGCSLGFEGHRCEKYTRENLAKFHPTSSSPAYNGIMQSGRAVDGRKTDLSAYGGQCFISDVGRSYVLWRVDLSNIRSIERIIIYYRTDNLQWKDYYPSRFRGFSLIISNTTNHRDGWTCYKDDSDAQTSIPPVMDIMCSVVGRYVIYYNERFPEYGSRPGYNQEAFAELCEVEVYGCPPHGYYGPHCKVPCVSLCKDYLENVAFLKATWMSNSMIGSDKAVDGKYTNLHYNGGQCTMSSLSQTATLWVNLEMNVAIDHVVIYFRTDNGPLGSNNEITAQLLGFFLYISNTTSRYDGVLCFRDTNFTRDTIPAVVNISCPYVGRYVIFYNERLPGVTYPSEYSQYTYSALCELQVYGCPSPVENLPLCSRPCSENCEECYPDSGACKKCKPGFQGLGCEIACQAIAKVSLWPSLSKLGKPSSFLRRIFTDGGVKFPAPKDYSPLAILLDLSIDSEELANVSFFIDHTEYLIIDFINSEKSPQRYEFTDPYLRTSKRKFTAYNDQNTKVSRIRITVLSKIDFTISNLILPLRDCVKIRHSSAI